MPKTYTRLTEDERYQIYEGVTEKSSHREIAALINKHHGTVSREVKRNRGLRGYRPKQAQEKTEERDQNRPRHIKLTDEVQFLITENIQQEWSPEQIQGRLKSEGLSIVCATTIYGFIQQDKASGGDLYKHLRHRKPYKKRTGSRDARGQIIGRVSIDERRSIVEEKVRIGDWESDTVIGKGHKGVLVTLADRVSKKTLIAHVPSKHAEVVKDAIIKLLKPEKDYLYTITFDNGKEFAYHDKIKQALGAANYFAHPYCSWERGLNENHNGLIRQYLPKAMPLEQLTNQQIKTIQDRLNNRPRKMLGYKTPNEVYDAMRLAA
jgi:IS30 family transposase